jgi:hypothetical protein
VDSAQKTARVAVPITFLNVTNEMAALTLLHGADCYRSSTNPNATMLFLTLHDDGVNLANIFWGLTTFSVSECSAPQGDFQGIDRTTRLTLSMVASPQSPLLFRPARSL